MIFFFLTLDNLHYYFLSLLFLSLLLLLLLFWKQIIVADLLAFMIEGF